MTKSGRLFYVQSIVTALESSTVAMIGNYSSIQIGYLSTSSVVVELLSSLKGEKTKSIGLKRRTENE
jgi:ribosomal protein L21